MYRVGRTGESNEIRRLLFLLENEQRLYKELLSKLSIGLLNVSIDGQVVDANQYAEQLLGPGITNKRVADVLPFPALAERMQEVFAKNTAQQNIYCVDDRFPLRISVQPLYSLSEDAPENVMLIIEDLRSSQMQPIGERRTAEILPESASQVQPLPAAEDASSGQSAPQAAVMVVEDEAPVRRLMSNSLKKQGYRVLEAANAQTALDLFEQQGDQVRLLIADLQLPGMGGAELSELVLSCHPGLKVLYICAFAAGVLPDGPKVDFLRKPFRVNVFIEKVKGLVTAP